VKARGIFQKESDCAASMPGLNTARPCRGFPAGAHPGRRPARRAIRRVRSTDFHVWSHEPLARPWPDHATGAGPLHPRHSAQQCAGHQIVRCRGQQPRGVGMLRDGARTRGRSAASRVSCSSASLDPSSMMAMPDASGNGCRVPRRARSTAPALRRTTRVGEPDRLPEREGGGHARPVADAAGSDGPRRFSSIRAHLCSSVVARDRDQTASKSPAAPMPPPMHMVTMPYFFFWRRSSSSRVPVMREPVMP